MPEKRTLRRAAKAKREGKAATTQAGEFVREEMDHAKRGKHRVKSRKQAIAIGLSKARRSGVKVPRKKAASGRAAGGAKRAASPRKATRRTPARKTAARKAPARKTAARRAPARRTAARRKSRAR